MAITLDKPSGLPVFPPHADPSGDCLLTRLLAQQPWRGEAGFPATFAGGIAHRLDNDTSGAIWVADDLLELDRMRQAFASGMLTKRYLFLASRDVSWHENSCDLAIAHDRRHKARMVVQRGANTPHRGRWLPTSTQFRHVDHRLWAASMSTGAMHQIRVHAAFVGLALAGDRLYGGGPPVDGQPSFCLHHVGLNDPAGWGTSPVPAPPWIGG